ncbi:MAG: hypothetical protein DPW15_13160, partial [Chloroflexi bacterium]|nr:hypothetical protein [Chloroflexota bacterium]
QKWHQGSRRFAPCFCWLSFLARFCYSFTLSSYQQFFSARTFDLIDLIASNIGLILGGWIAYKLKK